MIQNIKFFSYCQTQFGLAHRDIKPSNLFIKQDNSLVGDFGAMKKVVF